ncbi:MAG: hypothetical protein J5U19_11005 [Candidatus Methanoperedens sp.]|nr:hypothetical protein [Candidatus Methanoperedens sp.]
MMNLIRKNDFSDFVNALIRNEPGAVIGVISKEDKFVFDKLRSAEELRLEYDVTLLPPKKYFLPPEEPLLKYRVQNGFSVSAENEVIPLIIIGIHPYDLIAIEQMDRVFKDTYPDDNYIHKREAAILIGVNIKNVSSTSFAGSMGAATTEEGFDLMLTDLGKSYKVDIGSEKGAGILNKYAKMQDLDDETSKKVKHLGKEIASKFKKQIDFSPEELGCV